MTIGAARLRVAFAAAVIGLGTAMVWCLRRDEVPQGGRVGAAQATGDRPAGGNAGTRAESKAAEAAAGAGAARATPEPPEARWRRVVAAPGSIERDGELADILQELAETDADLAAQLLLSVPTAERQRIVTAALMDAARTPDRASRLAGEFVREDPGGSADHGYALVAALTRAKEFAAALTFIQRQNDAGGAAPEDPGKWLRALFAEWAKHDAATARVAAEQLASPSWRAEALRVIESAAVSPSR